MTEYWYRYEDVMYTASINEFGESEGPGTLKVELREFEVLSHTKTGVWINGPEGKRHVRRVVRKQFCCSTIEEAKRSFIARKDRQIAIYDARIKRAIDAKWLIRGRHNWSILRDDLPK